MKVAAKVQKWGNGLAIRVAGVMRDIPHFKDGTPIEVEITENGLIITKIATPKKNQLPYTEKALLADLNPENAHADLLAKPLDSEF
jgi:antitoxin MazE